MLPESDPTIRRRAASLLLDHQQRIYCRVDRAFAGLLVLQWLAILLIAYWMSPITSTAASSELQSHVRAALWIGGVATLSPLCLALWQPGAVLSRYAVAVSQMVMSALFIYVTAGHTATHFHVFASLALLALYRDWKVLIVASLVLVADHFFAGMYWSQSVYGVASAQSWLEHGAWVLFEDIFLITGCLQSVSAVRSTASQRAQLEAAGESIERKVVERTAEVQASAERFRSLSAASPIGIFHTDRSGQVGYVNERWREITGLTDGQALGHGWINALHPDDAEAVRRDWAHAVSDEHESSFEFRTQTPQGEIRWVRARTNPVTSENNQVTGHVGTLEDISTRKRTELELAEARDRALDAARLKSEFLANMSHEIRTPMNAIIGMTDMTLDTNVDQEQREYLEMVRHSAVALLTLINDILDVSKIESGRLLLEVVTFNLRASLNDVLRTLALPAHQKGLELACDVAHDVPESIAGDPGRLRQIVLNLVGNAIKFTDHGEVVLRVRVDSAGEQRVVLHFAVSDTGIGIAPHQQSVIFAPFVQGDGSMTRQYSGTGLGLTIASQLVELMSGRIWLESALGQGTTFHFTATFDFAAGDLASPLPGPESRALRVLIVDDSATSRGIYLEMLHGWGMSATTIGDGESALAELLRAHHEGRAFGLLLLDASLPDMDGPALARLIRADSLLSGLPIIMLTTSGAHTDRTLELSKVVSIMKPIARSHLLEAIESLSGKRATLSRIPRASMADKHKALHVLVAEDNAMNRRVVVRLLEKRGHTVVAVADGQAAVAVSAEPFDLVLMDIQMPTMNGLEATVAIRDREKARGGHVPIVALTAHAMKGDREKCLAAGMDAYVSKPVEAASLFATIEGLNKPTVARDAVANPAAAAQVLDYTALLTRVDDDTDFLLEVIDEFRGESAELLEQLRRAVGARDAAVIAQTAHSLKGALATLTAHAAMDAAARLDLIARSGDLSEVEPAWKLLLYEMTRLENELAPQEERQAQVS